MQFLKIFQTPNSKIMVGNHFHHHVNLQVPFLISSTNPRAVLILVTTILVTKNNREIISKGKHKTSFQKNIWTYYYFELCIIWSILFLYRYTYPDSTRTKFGLNKTPSPFDGFSGQIHQQLADKPYRQPISKLPFGRK